MSNARKPTLNRKVTPKDEDKRREILDQGFALTLDGETYTVRLGDITPQFAREIRLVTGRSFRALALLLEEDADVDVVADALWIAKRLAGEDVALEDVSVDYAQLAEGAVEAAGPAEEPDPADPEA